MRASHHVEKGGSTCGFDERNQRRERLCPSVAPRYAAPQFRNVQSCMPNCVEFGALRFHESGFSTGMPDSSRTTSNGAMYSERLTTFPSASFTASLLHDSVQTASFSAFSKRQSLIKIVAVSSLCVQKATWLSPLRNVNPSTVQRYARSMYRAGPFTPAASMTAPFSPRNVNVRPATSGLVTRYVPAGRAISGAAHPAGPSPQEAASLRRNSSTLSRAF